MKLSRTITVTIDEDGGGSFDLVFSTPDAVTAMTVIDAMSSADKADGVRIARDFVSEHLREIRGVEWEDGTAVTKDEACTALPGTVLLLAVSGVTQRVMPGDITLGK